MKLYNSVGPNPHVVRMYAAECGVALELEEVDLMGGANRQADYLKLNPSGQLPCLETEGGDLIADFAKIDFDFIFSDRNGNRYWIAFRRYTVVIQIANAFINTRFPLPDMRPHGRFPGVKNLRAA